MIIEAIERQIIIIINEGETRLLQLIYQVDIEEKEFLTILTQPNFLQLLSEKILIREAYKVFLRSKFK